MIILPAISGLIGFLGALIEPILIGAGIGALFSGGASVLGDTIKYREDGISREERIEIAENAGIAAAEGALFGGAFGAVGFVIAPAIAPAVTVVDDVGTQVIGTADDAAKAAASTVDDVARSANPRVARAGVAAASAADDAACPLLCRLGNSAKSLPGRVTAVFNRARNYHNANTYQRLSKGSGSRGYFYAMDDVSTAGRYKLGITTRPVERLREVQVKTGLKLDYTCIIGTDDMKSLEKTLFTEFDRQRRRDLVPGTTEIFILSAAQLSSVCSR